MKQPEDPRKGEWSTPWEFFNPLQAEFNPQLDVAASPDNTKCKLFFSKKDDGLLQDWSGKRVWMNPPYGRKIGMWIKKAASSQTAVCVCLLPARTDTRWFHEFIYNRPGVEIRFIKGRIKFSSMKGGGMFPSMVVIFKPLAKLQT